ncbi:TetR/AcrR family transcriptional regulator [Arachnia propionica]|uniref:TetR/AcrR family transcriptional regulator n=1 Tax=Arachnia propionica TaxID=1750 RepID=UPI001FEC6253|nr:TetR/AcrR family transcriptional regulator [Arachnia propionica]
MARAVLEVGFPQLTFTAVRERLGVGESTLFRYAPDRDELVRLGLGLAMESVKMPPRQGPWRQVLTDYAVFAWRFWEAHPGSATEVSRGVFTLVMVRLSDELCSFLMECGFTARNALLTCDLVFDMVVDSRRGVEHMDGLSAEAGPERDYMKKQWVSDEPEESPVSGWKKIRQAKLEAVNLPPFDWFMKKLEVLLDGVAASLAPRE